MDFGSKNSVLIVNGEPNHTTCTTSQENKKDDQVFPLPWNTRGKLHQYLSSNQFLSCWEAIIQELPKESNNLKMKI
jgi:hypothetical protein